MHALLILLLAAVLLVLAVPVLLVASYLALLTLLSARLPAPPPGRSTRLLVLVPAHNEAAVIERTVQSLLAMDYPQDLFRVQVIADNCVDDTAALARSAGAAVWERQHASLRGKGYALQFAYEKVLAEGWAEAVVIVDADTEVSANLLGAFAARVQAGAGAVQAFYGVLNPLASWRTRLVTIALAIFHRLRGRARARLGVSNKLNGNGMCFTAATLRRVPHEAFSIAEDLEYGIALGRAGIAVSYADEAEVRAEMVSTAKAAESQRQRWESGRAQMRQLYGWPLLGAAFRQRSALLLDLALDVLVPPLSTVALFTLLLAALGLLLAWFTGIALFALPGLLALAALLLHVLRGVVLSGLGLQGWLDLALAPGYVVWKLLLRFQRKGPKDEWVRTTREQEGKPPN